MDINPTKKLSARQTQELRQRLKQAIRSFLFSRNYQEVETPIAVACPGTEVHLRYFATDWIDIEGKPNRLYLRSSPELHMKQLLASGMERIFQFATCFRNHGEFADWHHPEFTLLEWYRVGMNYQDFITETSDLISYCAREMAPHIDHAGLTPGVIPPTFERITLKQAFERFASIDLVDRDPSLAKKAIQEGVLSVNEDDDFETTFFKVLLDRIEPELAKRCGVVLLDYPASQAALAVEENGVARRFEFYLGKTELSNGFKELLGEDENRRRVSTAMQERRRLGHEVPPEDGDFYEALRKGLPPCCGNALGFDRLLAILCGMTGVETIIPFRKHSIWQKFNGDN